MVQISMRSLVVDPEGFKTAGELDMAVSKAMSNVSLINPWDLPACVRVIDAIGVFRT